ncbi:hypothetical protein MTO96_037141 [Rhipicephalus appendiculatus]
MLRSASAGSFSQTTTRLSHHSPIRLKRRGYSALSAMSQKSPAAHIKTAPLHRSRLLAVAIRDAIPPPPQLPPAPTTVEAAVALLRSARPDLLAQGALSLAPPNLPLQPPVDDLLDFEE